ncbi:MAG: cation:proton antiporter [Legionellaceae bacterium]|nr:cation:proton antiporter [Legionellaceae bacterium]
MEHSLPLIPTLAIALSLSLILGFLAVKLKLPAIVGYLLAGILIGPYTPGFVANADIAQELAEIGVMLLMFGVGLHFSLDELLEVHKIALPGALVQIITATALGMSAALYWGWSYGGALIFGLALSVASTVVLLRALEKKDILNSINGRIAVGWLIVEDIFMVVILVLLPPLGQSLGGHAVPSDKSLWFVLFITVIKISTFIALMLLVGRRLFPKLLAHISRTHSRELFTLGVVTAAVGIAYGASKLFGVSFALGAFFAGMIMRESKFSQRAAEESLPLRDAFAVLFFVAVGMLFNPNVLLEQPLQILAVVSIIMIGKSIAAFAIVLLFRYPISSACVVSASLAQIGEFSFILAELGVRLGLLPIEGRSYILAGALISIAMNPLIFKVIESIPDWTKSRSAPLFHRSKYAFATLSLATKRKYLTRQAVVVGYGEVGKCIADALLTKGIPYVIVDENQELIEFLRINDMPAVHGDATLSPVLIEAHITRASILIIAVSNGFDVKPIIDCARSLNPNIEIVIRTTHENDDSLSEDIEPGKIFFVEDELAKNMSRYILNRFGKFL